MFSQMLLQVLTALPKEGKKDGGVLYSCLFVCLRRGRELCSGYAVAMFVD